MKRQRGRNRGGGGGGQPKHNANRSFDSNGPEGIKVRGAAQGVFEKYTQLARDASSAGDRVLAENYLQHAEHYYRVVRAMQPQRPVSEIIGKEGYSGGFDIDFEAEPEEATVDANDGGEASEGGEGEGQRERNFDNNNNNNGRREDRPRFENRDRQDRDRQDRDRGQDRGDRNFDRPNTENRTENREGGRRDRWRDRDDRPRDDRPRDDRPREDRAARDDRPREERAPREDRPAREDRPVREERAERTFEREDRPREERVREERAPREERPRRERFEREPREEAASVARDEDTGPRLRGQDGAVSEAPAFLSRGPSTPVPAPVAAEGEAAPKPRRPRAPRKIVVSEGEV